MGKPNRIVVGGKKYRATVLKVIEEDSLGPRMFQLLRDDESTDIEGGEQFWIVYVSEEMLAKVKVH